MSYSEMNPIFGPLYPREHFSVFACQLDQKHDGWLEPFCDGFCLCFPAVAKHFLSFKFAYRPVNLVPLNCWSLKLENNLPRESKNRLWELH